MGLESTVLDVQNRYSSEQPLLRCICSRVSVVLRPGGISVEALREILPDVTVFDPAKSTWTHDS